ncbi:MAG: flippase, partial [Chloroflexi bacterium]|nr:flippase [Chloroflexota bacterium]
AFGVQALQSHAQQPVARRNIRRLGWVLIALGGAVLGGLAASYIFYDTAEALIDRLYTGLAKAQDTFPSVKSFYSYQFGNVLGLGAFLAAAGGILWLSTRPTVIGRGRWKVPPWQPLAIIVILIDLFIATYDFNPRADPDWLEYKPESVAWLQWRMEAEGPFRIQAYNWGEEPLNANSGWRYGLHDVRGYDSLFSQGYAALMGQIAPQGGLDHNRIDSIYYNNPQALADPWLDFLNVRYIITDWLIREEDNPAALGYRLVHTDAGVRIYENLDALPRAYTLPVPDNGVAYQPGEGCLFESAVRPEEPRHLTYFPPINGACIPVQPAAITQYDDTEVRIDALIDEDVWLILADNYAEGWRAFVKPKGEPDDAEEEIDLAQVNLNLRGVKLPPGAWTVRFKYSPPSFQVGGFVSFVAGMLAVFAALVWLWRAFVSETTQEDTGRRLIKNSAAPIGLNLFNRGIDFAFAFIMLRILGPADAGIYYYAIVIFGWFDIFTNFGLNTLLTRDVSRQPESAGRYLYNTSILRLGLAGLGIPALALVLLIRNTTVDPALDPTAVAAIILLYIGLVPNSISTGLTALFYAFERAEFPAAMTTVSTLIKVTLGLAALLLGWGVVGLAGVSIITNLVTFLVLGRLAWPLLRENWQPVPDGALQRTMLREAWPLMINHLLATIFFKSDVILMEAINGVSVVGIYSTAYKWLDALNIIPAFFTMALLPVLSRQAQTHQEALRRNYVLGTKILFMLALPVAVMTTFLAPILVGILGGRQFLPDGAVALQLMIWSIPVGWMNSLTQYVLIALDRQRQITGAFIAAVSFNIITNLAFLPVYSFRAAAITTILSEIVLFVGFFWLIRQVIGTIHWPMRLWKIAFATGMMLVITASLWTIAPFAGLMAGPLLYVIILWWLKPFDSDEEARLSTVLPGRLQRLVLRRAPQAP